MRKYFIVLLFLFAGDSDLQGQSRLSQDLFTGKGLLPIGSIIAVMPSTHSAAWQPPADCSTIKNGWMRTTSAAGVSCVVPTCLDCVIPAGTTLPNLHQRYVKGGVSGTTGGANTQASNVSIANHTLSSSNVAQVTGSFTSSYANFGPVTLGYRDYNNSGCTGPINGYSYLGGGSYSLNNHTHTISSVTAGNASPTSVTHSVSNPLVNNEPPYVNVVWIMRVK